MNNKKLVTVILFFACFNIFSIFSQSSDFPKIMYVNATEGLRGRAEPSIDSIRIGVFLHGSRIQVLERSRIPVTIDGITDYWYKVNRDFVLGSTYYRYSWVFGGYLSEKLPLDVPVILGKWDVLSSSYRYYFFSNHNYAEGYPETEGDFSGTWSLNGDIITLMRSRVILGEEPSEYETLYVQLIIIDHDTINLKFQGNKIVSLKRSSDNW